MKKLATNIGVFLVSTTVAFLLAEVMVRIINTDNPYLMPRYHTSANYGEFQIRRIRPNMEFTHTTLDGSWHFRTNAQGFRNDKDFTYERPPGTLRVVALGDSHTQGYECDQDLTYSAVVERYLNKSGLNAEVINTGVSGFGNAEALVLLENEMINYSPDVVILGFFGNDFNDNIRSGLYSLKPDGSLQVENKSYLPGVWVQDVIYAIPGIKWLGENSYFYSLLFNGVWDFFKFTLPKIRGAEVDAEMMTATGSGKDDHDIRLAAALINRIAEVSKANGAEFYVLDIPGDLDSYNYTPSVTPQLRAFLIPQVNVIQAHTALQEYSEVARFHVQHGGRHITEFTHAKLGVEVARQIVTDTLAENESDPTEI